VLGYGYSFIFISGDLHNQRSALYLYWSSLSYPNIGNVFSYIQGKVTYYVLFSIIIASFLIPLFALNLLVLSNSYYSSIGIFLLLIRAQVTSSISELEFWGLMNHLFNLTQAKRLFGLIGATFSFSMALTGLAIPFLLNFFSAKVLLLFASFAFCLCFGILSLLKRNFPEQMLLSQSKEENNVQSGPSTPFPTIFSGLKSPYILLIFTICFLLEISHFLVDMTFNTGVQHYLVTQENMTSFLGLFFACANILEVILRLFLFPFIVRKFGVISAALMLPIIMTGITLAALSANLISGLTVLFFWLIVINKLFHEDLRYAILEPAKLLLLQLFIPSVRIWIYSKIETIIYPTAVIITALIVLLSSQFIQSEMTILLSVIGLLGLLMLYCLYLIKTPYITSLSESIKKRYFSTDVRLPIDKNTLSLLEIHSHSPHPGEAIYSLEILEKTNRSKFLIDLPSFLDHPSDLVKEFAINAIRRNSLKQFYPELLLISRDSQQKNSVRCTAIMGVASLAAKTEEVDVLNEYLKPNTELKIQCAAITGLLKHGSSDMKYIANNSLIALSSSLKLEERLASAKVLADLPEFDDAQKLISMLLKDTEPAVQKAALGCISQSHLNQFFPFLINSLENQFLRAAAFQRALQLGDSMFPFIASGFSSFTKEKKIQVLNILGKIKFKPNDKEKVINWLFNRLNQYNIDMCIWKALFELGYRIKNEESRAGRLLNDEIEKMIHELSYLVNLSSLLLKHKGVEALNDLLRGQMTNLEQNIYQLLCFTYPEFLIKRISQGINLNEEKIGYAIELIHQTIKKKYSSKIAELVTKVHLELKSSNTKAQSDSKELSNLLKEIALNKPGNLSTAVRAAALFLLVKLSLPINPEFFTYSQFQEDPVLKETSEWALSNARL
jgi:hypothetical protein